MKEITVFSYGDSSSLETWSNVPYFLTTTLESKGIKVNRVNIAPNRYINAIWNRIILKCIRIFLHESTYDYQRTPFFRISVQRKMKKAVQIFNNTDAFISISFSYHPKKYTKKKVMMFCDWTYDYYFDYFLKRQPDFLEKQEIRNQHKLQQSVDAMVVLFPDVANYIRRQRNTNNVFYLGNVINSREVQFEKSVLLKKWESQKIVFIGSIKYIEGLRVLVNAVERLKRIFPAIQLDIIGVTTKQFEKKCSSNIHFWGYLNKSEDEQNKKYYEIVDAATIFVNTTPRWSSFSATLDVMYHYTPVIVSSYRSFQDTFGEKIEFGFYSQNVIEDVLNNITYIFNLNSEQYIKMAENARQNVEPYSWNNYVEQLLDVF